MTYPDREAPPTPPSKIYWRLVLRLNLKYCPVHFAHPFLILHGLESRKSDLDFQSHLCRRVSKRSKPLNILETREAPMIGLCLPMAVQIRPMKMGGKTVKSSTTQPCIDRFCYNLVGWCITNLVIEGVNDWRDGRTRMTMRR